VHRDTQVKVPADCRRHITAHLHLHLPDVASFFTVILLVFSDDFVLALQSVALNGLSYVYMLLQN